MTRIEINEPQQKLLNSIDLSGLSPEERRADQQLIPRNATVFSVVDSHIANITSTQMEIKLQHKTPVQLICHSVPKPLHATQLQLCFKPVACWIKSSYWNSLQQGLDYQLFIFPHFHTLCWYQAEKNGWSLHVCCDYRQLNRRTIPDRHPLSKIQNTLENLGSGQYFSILDQGKTYHKIHLSPESRHLAAFIAPWDFYDWLRMPFRLMNATVVFQRFMEQSFQDCRDHFVVPYHNMVLLSLVILSVI